MSSSSPSLPPPVPADRPGASDAVSGRAPVRKSNKLDNVCYDIRGPVLAEANRLEEAGHKVVKLNIGNPAPFGFDAPEEILQDVKRNLADSQGYCDSRGLHPARKAVMQYCQQIAINGVQMDHIYLGNGVSELIAMGLQALLNNGDQILVPAPDYPLWTAAASLAGGEAVHYRCDEAADWAPDIDHLRSCITPHTRALVVINPNNPTGAVYPRSVLEQLIEVARQHDLVLFSDEIYDKILYDGTTHTALASLADDLLIVTLNGLSKTYRVAGFRTGWMVLSGATGRARDYIEGLDILASMRLCSNVPSQHAVQTALGGHQSIHELTCPGGRLYEQRQFAWDRLNAIPGISCTLPKGALYLFPRVDPERFAIHDDERMVFDLLRQERILIVQGTAFHWPQPDHFRVVFLPHVAELNTAMDRLEHFFSHYLQS